jgi:hypothetical protein
MATVRARALWLIACGAGLSLGACNQLLDIQDAKVDARLSAAGRKNAPADTAGVGGTSVPATGGSGGLPGAGREDSAGAAMTGAKGGEGGSEPEQPEVGGKGGQATGGKSSGSGGKGGTPQGGGNEGGEGAVATMGDAGDSSMGPKDPCEDYCDEMDAVCTGEAMQYRDRAQCMTICGMLPPGDDQGDQGEDDDSVACRLKYVKKTKYALGAEVTAYCQQAGPCGNGKCGSTCEAFCSLMMQVCTEEIAGPNHFDSEEDCLATCNALPASPVAYSPNDPRVSDGNHAECRLFHVSSAAMADAEEHCEHAMGITLCQATP